MDSKSLEELRPFLQPLFALRHGPPENVPIKWTSDATQVLDFIIEHLKIKPRRHICSTPLHVPGVAASDAAGGGWCALFAGTRTPTAVPPMLPFVLLAWQVVGALGGSPLTTKYTIDEGQRGREFLG